MRTAVRQYLQATYYCPRPRGPPRLLQPHTPSPAATRAPAPEFSDHCGKSGGYWSDSTRHAWFRLHTKACVLGVAVLLGRDNLQNGGQPLNAKTRAVNAKIRALGIKTAEHPDILSKGPAPGWGWPSLGGLPTPAPANSARRHDSILGPGYAPNNGWRPVCPDGISTRFCWPTTCRAAPPARRRTNAHRDQAAEWNFCCAAVRPSVSSSSTASAASPIRNGSSLASAEGKSLST